MRGISLRVLGILIGILAGAAGVLALASWLVPRIKIALAPMTPGEALLLFAGGFTFISLGMLFTTRWKHLLPGRRTRKMSSDQMEGKR